MKILVDKPYAIGYALDMDSAANLKTEDTTMANTDSSSLYAALKAAGVELDNHESDLHVKDCEAARAIFAQQTPPVFRTTFTSQDGALWWDVPFMYLPWWAARSASTRQEG